jgi:hypothetical protein
VSFWEFELRAEAVHIGERIKKGTFRPLVPAFESGGREYRPLPYSTAVGSLKEYLGLKWDTPLHAAGYFTEGEEEELTIAPRDNVTGAAKLPITIQYLARARGKIFVLVDDQTNALPERLEMPMGGLRYKGLGLCRLNKASGKPIEPEKGEGFLLTRIPEAALAVFGVDPEQVRGDGLFRRGYLFKPTSMLGGLYVKSLFEGSKVKGFDFLLGGGSWKAL